MPSAVKQKSIYRPFARIEKFYTGGSICLNADGKTLVCACADEAKVVDIASGRVTATLAGDTEPVTSIAASPNGHTVFVASRSLTTRCWDVRTPQCIRSFQAHRAPTIDMAMDESGGLLATGSAQREVKVWDAAGGFCTHAFTGHAGIVLRVLFHPTQLLLVSAGDDGKVCVWDLVDKARVAELKGHVSAVTAVAWSPSAWQLLSAGRDKVVVLWDIRTFRQLRTVAVFESVETMLVFPHGAAVPGVPLDTAEPDARPVFFATGGESGAVRVWDGQRGASVYKLDPRAGGSHAREVVELLAVPGSGQLVAASADCRVTLLQASRTGLRTRQTLLGYHDEVTAVAFLGDPEPAASHSAQLDALRVPDSTTAPPASFPPTIVLATNTDLVHLLSTPTMSCFMTLAGHTDTVLAARAFQIGGAWLLATASKDKTVRVWSGETGECVALGDGHLSAVTSLDVHVEAGGSAVLLSGAADKLARAWDLGSLERSLSAEDGSTRPPAKLRVLATVGAHQKDVNAVAIAGDGRTAATGGADRLAKLWSLPSLSAPRTLRGHRRGVWDVRFAPVETLVLTASGDATLRLWNVKDGACLRTLAGHGASVLRACFLSLGAQVISAGSDGLAKLWSVASGECLETMEVADAKVWGLDVGGAAEAAALTGAADGSLTLWADTTDADEAVATAQAEARLLHQQEMANALADRDYLRAAQLAFRLRQPGRLLSVVQHVLADGGEDAHAVLKRLVGQFSTDELGTAVSYVRDWNTSSRHCQSAQALLHAILATETPDALARVKGVRDTAEALMLYTERHFKRVDRLLQGTFVLDFLLQRAQAYSPDETSAILQAETDHTAPLGSPADRFTLGIAALGALPEGKGGKIVTFVDGDNHTDAEHATLTTPLAAVVHDSDSDDADESNILRRADLFAVDASDEHDGTAWVDVTLPDWGAGFDGDGSDDGHAVHDEATHASAMDGDSSASEKKGKRRSTGGSSSGRGGNGTSKRQHRKTKRRRLTV